MIRAAGGKRAPQAARAPLALRAALAAALAGALAAAPDVGNIALMPRVPASYELVDWRARAAAFVAHALSPASAAAGTTEFYRSSSLGPSLGLGAFDVATYVGTPPKRESFPPLETLLTAAALGRRLDTSCTAQLDDCVATALQYALEDGVIGHWVAPSAASGPTVVEGGQLWDFIYSGILVASTAAAYPDYRGGALGPPIVANALKWHEALLALGGGTNGLDLNVSGFNFSAMEGIAEPAIYRQPSSSAGIAWLALAAREWQRYRNASAAPLAELQQAADWALAYLDALDEGFFENLVGFGALAAARENAERNATYDVERMLRLAFQDGSRNQKHGWGVIVDSWGGKDVSGTVGFVEEWDPSQPYGAGGSEAYFGDGLWLAASVAPIARYNTSFAHSIGHWLVNLCSASRLFYADALPPGSQTDFGDARNPGGAVFPYEALRACDFVRERGNCTADSPAPFATGDYGCEFPTGSPQCATSPPPPCTNLAGYGGASVGVAAALCAPTNALAVLQADLLATDAFHAPARPTFLVHNPHAEAIRVEVAVPGCALVHWAGAGAAGEPAAPAPAAAAAAAAVAGDNGLCAVMDAASGAVLARGVAAGGAAEIEVAPDTALVIVCVPDGGAVAAGGGADPLELLAAATAPAAMEQGCATEDDCSLLGDCIAGACVCTPGWAGADCARADLLPFDPDAATGYVNETAASWGGHPLPDPAVPGRWWLMVSEMASGCPLWFFENNSYVARAVSETGPGGPYRHVDTARVPFSHSVQAIGPTPDGFFVLFYIGLPDAAAVIDCAANGVPPRYVHPNPPSMNVLSIAWARSLDGPWESRPLFSPNASALSAWDCAKTNPAPLLLSNGTVLLAFRSTPCPGGGGSGGEYLGLASAPHWNATAYGVHGAPAVAPSDGTGYHEDPYLFEDARGRLHIISHNQGPDNVCNRTGSQSCGAHLYSRDGSSWAVSASPVYDLLELKNGTLLLPATRQRPQLVLDGATRAPLWLFNGAMLVGKGNSDLAHLTHTLAFQFRLSAGPGGAS
jgi:hypothetical protein